MINMIYARNGRGGIGINNKLPWKNSLDMKIFRALTTMKDHDTVFGGLPTIENMPKLKDRKTIGLTRNSTFDPVIKSNADDFKTLDEIKDMNGWIIGGGKIYHESVINDVVTGVVVETVISSTEPTDTFFQFDSDIHQEFNRFKICDLEFSNNTSKESPIYEINVYQNTKTCDSEYVDMILDTIIEVIEKECPDVEVARVGVRTYALW